MLYLNHYRKKYVVLDNWLEEFVDYDTVIDVNYALINCKIGEESGCISLNKLPEDSIKYILYYQDNNDHESVNMHTMIDYFNKLHQKNKLERKLNKYKELKLLYFSIEKYTINNCIKSILIDPFTKRFYAHTIFKDILDYVENNNLYIDTYKNNNKSICPVITNSSKKNFYMFCQKYSI